MVADEIFESQFILLDKIAFENNSANKGIDLHSLTFLTKELENLSSLKSCFFIKCSSCDIMDILMSTKCYQFWILCFL